MLFANRIVLAASLTVLSMLAGCVDPAHSRFANVGQCEVSTGSNICATGPADGVMGSANDPAVYHPVGALPGH